ncbi:MAG: signal peptidase I [Proteobacteria bacterium]|nr:signal peptidase I [Pseudomonadota bacterium]
MDLKHAVRRFWYFLWFVGIPFVLAWIVIDVLVRNGILEEVEVWYILLLSVILASVTYALRDNLPFWRDPNLNSSYNKRLRRKEAALLLKNVRKILSKKGARVSNKGKSDLDAAISKLTACIRDKNDEKITAAVQKLEKATDRYLAFAKKSAGREYVESIGIAIIVAIVLRLFVLEAFKIPSESMVPTLMVGDHIFVSKYRYGLSVPLSNKRLIRFANPKHGEVVVFLKPTMQERMGMSPEKAFFPDETSMDGKDFIKRIVGLPGDIVEMKSDQLYINGKIVPRCPVGTQTYRTRTILGGWEDTKADLWIEQHGDFRYTIIEEKNGNQDNFGPVTIRDDHVFVLGDNRDNSNDSRYWGSVPFDNIKGRAMIIWWSNLRPYGFQWSRVGTFIMNTPKLDEQQKAALAQCPNMR